MLNKMIYLTRMSVLFVLFLCIARQVSAADVSVENTSKAKATAIPTFHCIGLYWTPEKDSSIDKRVLVKFRATGGEWRDGLPMRYNVMTGKKTQPVCIGDYRGSIVNLTPNTLYEIVLELEDRPLRTVLKVKTWNEEFKIAKTIKGSDITSTLKITEGGSAEEGYVLYDGTGNAIDCSNKSPFGISVEANYVIIRGYTIKNTTEHGIFIPKKKNAKKREKFSSWLKTDRSFKGDEIHHVVIENCDISKWGSADKSGFGGNYQAGVYSMNESIHNFIIQRCKIHHPNTDTNSWAEEHIKRFDIKHPAGPQAIAFFESAGGHVIRYNECWSDKDHYFSDVIGFEENWSWTGFPGADSDIYCNYTANAWDDAIEVEGGGRNVRVWNNYMEETMLAIGNAANSIGPTYFWNNVSGRSYTMPGSKYGMTHGPFFKMGYAGPKRWMSGHFYCFNNTILQPNNEGMKGFGPGRPLKHCVTRNNLIHVRETGKKRKATAIGSHYLGGDNDLDYDMMSSDRYPKKADQLAPYDMVSIKRLPKTIQEPNAIVATPKYTEKFGFNFEAMTGNFQLAPDSRGYDEGVIIPNFSEGYKGKAPDMGAHEAGTPPIQYGVKANFVPAGGDK